MALLVAAVFSFARIYAQNYPLQISAQLVPPFSGYVPDYAVPGEEKFKLLCLFTDFTEPSYNFKLKIRIQGQGVTLQSKSYYFAGPFNITPGAPIQLSGADLAGLLNTNNLDFSGITLADYNHRKILPEGFYSICVTAYDFNNPVPIQVSNEACAFAWFTLSDPPLLDLPQCGNTLNTSTPQQVTFQWTPMNISSPNSFLNTEYDFQLFEVLPSNANPNTIVQTLPPIFQITTTFTTLNYGITEPPLVTGRQYAWRVRARDVTGRDLFRNSGYSQVCAFTYGNIYGDLLNLTLHAQVISSRVARLWWDSISNYQSYHVEYRKSGNNWNWFPINITAAHAKATDLEPDMDYEARVNGITNENVTGPWSNTVTFHTSPLPVINCGDQPVPLSSQNIHPLTMAAPGNTWQIGQFELIVTQLQNLQSSSGIYSGLGKVVLPLGGINVRCSFTNVMVDEDHRVVSGEVLALSEGVSAWLSQWSSTYHYDDSFNCSCDIDSIYVNANNQVIIVCQGGDTIVVPDDIEGGLLVTDGNGNQWVVNGDGTIVPVEGGGLLPVTQDTLTATEKSILRKALLLIKTEYDQQKLNNLLSVLNSGEQDYDDYIRTQRSTFTQTGNAPQEYHGETEYVGSFELKQEMQNTGTAKAKNYKDAEFEYNKGKVLYIFSRKISSDNELNFIGQYLTVSNKLFKAFVAEQFALNKTEDQVAADVALLGLKPLAEMVVKRKMEKDKNE